MPSRPELDAYVDLLDTALPGVVHGVYLTGSAALGDWRPGHSDLDILTVTTRPLATSDLDALAALHAGVARRPYLDAVYVHRDQVGARDGDLPHAVDGEFRRDGHTPDPVLWATLDRHAVTVAGPPPAGFRAAPDPAWLRDWNLRNLDTYWRTWAAGVRELLAVRDPESVVRTDTVVWGVLGPGRPHHTVATGEIISKTASADHTAALCPEYAGLVTRARTWRLGDATVTFTATDGLAMCDLIDAIVDRAAAL
jgi:hypothetical protein